MSENIKKIVVNIQKDSIMVYDEISMDRIDLVSNDTNGKEQLIEIVKQLLEE